MRLKRTLAAITIAAGLLVSPLPPLLQSAGLGSGTAFAQECRLEVTVCQEIDLVFWKYKTCFTYRAFCG